MKETEIVELQRKSDNKQFYLAKVGMFYHAYDAAAYALSRVTGYKVREILRRSGDKVLIAGFPINKLPEVKFHITNAGGLIDDKTSTEDMICFYNLNSEPVEIEICEEKKFTGGYSKLLDLIANYNLSNSTPMDAMMFLYRIQCRLNTKKEEE
jgi:hypothetical protein